MNCGTELLTERNGLICPACGTKFESKLISIYEAGSERVETYRIEAYLRKRGSPCRT
ncbi:hypothetical protein [Candidatus Pyrohabitans sp.]